LEKSNPVAEELEAAVAVAILGAMAGSDCRLMVREL
jgi:hypothetical protein